jgi:hypothetical protein
MMAMEMGDAPDIAAAFVDFQVDRQLARQPDVAAMLSALKIDDHQIVGRCVVSEGVRRQQYAVGDVSACADMAKPVDESAAIEEPPRRDQLFGQCRAGVCHSGFLFCVL